MKITLFDEFPLFLKRKVEISTGTKFLGILFLLFSINYFFGLTFYVSSYPIVFSLLFYGVSVIALGLSLSGNLKHLKVLVFPVLLLWAVQSFPMSWFVMEYSPRYSWKFAFSVGYNLKAVFFFLLVPFIWEWRSQQKQIVHFGRAKSDEVQRQVPWIGYLLILLVMAIPIYFAAGDLHFQKLYPRYKSGLMEMVSGLSYATTFSMYQVSYLVQFVAVEWFFRAFLLRHLSKNFGQNSVLLATGIYVLIHFTKPMAEAIGSLFGGFFLCFLVLRTKSIKGGLLLHFGIAIMMEIFALWHAS